MIHSYSNPEYYKVTLRSGANISYKLTRRRRGYTLSLAKIDLQIQEINLSPNDVDQILRHASHQHSSEVICISLSDLGLSKLPRPLISFPNLKSLDCSKNNLQSFGKDLITLKSLERLDLSFNKLKELPQEIYLLNKLEFLDLSSNLFEELDYALFGLLDSINIDSNPLKERMPPSQQKAMFISEAQSLFNSAEEGLLNIDTYLKNKNPLNHNFSLHVLIRLATLEDNEKHLCGGIIDSNNKLYDLLYYYLDQVDIYRTRGLHTQLRDMKNSSLFFKRQLSFSEDTNMSDGEKRSHKKTRSQDYCSQ